MIERKTHKIIEGLREAVVSAKCDHDLIPQPHPVANSTLRKFYCTKCKATIWTPKIGKSRR